MHTVKWITGFLVVLLFFAGSVLEGSSTKPEKLQFMGWKDSYRLKAGSLEAVVVPTVGRMMSLRYDKGENLFLLKEKRAGFIPSLEQTAYVGLGGLYTWIAPQDYWVKPARQKYNFLDMTLDFGPYKVTRATAEELTMVSPVSETYGLQIEKKFKLADRKPRLEYTVTLTNKGNQPVRWSIWNTIAVQQMGIVYFQTLNGESDFKFFANHSPEMYKRMFGKTLRATGDNLGIADFRKYTEQGSKAYVQVGSPYLAYRQRGTWLIRSFEADTLALFTDQQSQIELFANAAGDNYYEIEVLSPDYRIKPGESASWTETMYIVIDDEPMQPDAAVEAKKLPKILKSLGVPTGIK